VSSEGLRIEPFFLEGSQGPLFCQYTVPAGTTPRGAVLYLHPFAEEMHKSRRMAARMARALAAAGFAVLQPDLTGCGDSAGDFSDANLGSWRADAKRALAWLADRVPEPPALWGLRLGATLAAELAAEAGTRTLVLWQPVPAGELFLNQFLRIKLASEMLADGKAQADTRALRESLEGGAVIEVGGYGLSPAMARDLAGLRLEQLADIPGLLVDASGVAGRAIGAAAFEGLEVAGKAVLIRTDWSRRWGTLDYWAPGPFLSAAGARWLAERMVLLLQTALLVQHAPAFVSDAFITARLRQNEGTYGVVDLAAQDVEAILERARPA